MAGLFGPSTPADDFVIDSFGVRGPVGPAPLAPLLPWVVGAAYVAGPPASFVSFQGASWACAADHLSSAQNPPDAQNPLWQLVAAPAPPEPPMAAILYAIMFG